MNAPIAPFVFAALLLRVADIHHGTVSLGGADHLTCPPIREAEEVALTFAYESRQAALIVTANSDLGWDGCDYMITGIDLLAIDIPSNLSASVFFDGTSGSWKLDDLRWSNAARNNLRDAYRFVEPGSVLPIENSCPPLWEAEQAGLSFAYRAFTYGTFYTSDSTHVELDHCRFIVRAHGAFGAPSDVAVRLVFDQALGFWKMEHLYTD